MSPLVSHVYQLGLIEAMAIPQTRVLRGAAIQFARSEGIVPAPEPTHAHRRRRARGLGLPARAGEPKVILTALCGHGHLDLASYDKFLHGGMQDLELSDEALAEAMRHVPEVA